MDTTTVTSVIRSCSLANLEAILNICANAGELIGISIGIFLIFRTFLLWKKNRRKAIANFIVALVSTTSGIAAPGVVNWLVSDIRDATRSAQ